MMRPTPMRATMGEKFAGFSRDMKMLSDWMPLRDRIHAVSVVPISAPMMAPTVLPSSMMPELTRPTSMTVRAEEDWMAMVMAAPSARLFQRLDVSRCRTTSSLPPATFSRLDDMMFMPNRKKARPPIIVRTEKMVIICLSPCKMVKKTKWENIDSC